jgi:hypothetical protein
VNGLAATRGQRRPDTQSRPGEAAGRSKVFLSLGPVRRFFAAARSMDLRAALTALLALGAVAVAVSAAEPSLVMIQSAPGRFEIAAVDSNTAHAIAAAAEDGWRVLAGPLALPERFPSPIFLRVVPAGEAGTDPAAFRVTVEAGGIVAVRLRGNAASAPVVRRAIVQSLLMRIAVGRHGVSPRLTVPLWLELGCIGWWETRIDAAQLDASKQSGARTSPPAIETLLGGQRGGEESRSQVDASMWLLTFFQSESTRNREWSTLLLHLLNGEDPLLAVAVSYPGRFSSAETRELWWRTGYYSLCRARTLPTLEAAESRVQLASLGRFVFGGDDTDKVVSIATVLRRANEPIVSAEIGRRVTELERLIPSLHPFYRNAGLSLAAAFASREARKAKQDEACTAFEQDWRDAIELESATTHVLDGLEARRAR